MRVARLSVIIMTTCYFIGLFWHIFCLELYLRTLEANKKVDPRIVNTETFITSNDLVPDEEAIHNLHIMLLGMYFAFTTLSTVGFGDFNPRSDYERLICIVILLMGVGIFALFMGLLLEMIEEFKAYDADMDLGDELS